MKFGTNLAHGVEKLWLKFGDFIMDRNGDMKLSLESVSAGQFERMRGMEFVLLALISSLSKMHY